MFLTRSNLLTRLVILVLVATIPALLVLLTFQSDLNAQRDDVVRQSALHKAELINLALGNVIDGAGQVMTTVDEWAAGDAPKSACNADLDRLRSRLPAYTFMAVVRADGSTICDSPQFPNGLDLGDLAKRALLKGSVVVGRYAAAPEPTICLGQASPAMPGQPPSVIVLGLSLDWLGRHLADMHRSVGGTVVIADREGTVLASVATSLEPPGQKLPAELMQLRAASHSGTVIRVLPSGHTSVVGYVPAPLAPIGLFVAASFEETNLAADIDAAATRGYLLIAFGGGLSILLALLAVNRFVRAPTNILLDVARRWRDGDLTGRAAIPASSASEFQLLGVAFNEMAETMQEQRSELHGLNEALEERVAERTRALLDSNNRLQVEVAERELTEATLRKAQKLQAIGQLADGIAHDFNNLLTAVGGSLDLLRNRVPPPDARDTHLLDTAAEAVAHGSRLTAQLLAFSRNAPLVAVPTDVAAAITGMGGLLTNTLGPMIRVEARLAADLWPALLDINQFNAAILNLALNARDAMPTGGKLTIAASNIQNHVAERGAGLNAGDYLRIIVADTGAGMPEDVLAHVFEPFFTTKEPGRGSGIGLSQVHGMVRQSGGHVQVESRVGDGTRVVILLPRSSQPLLPPSDAVAPALLPPSPGGTILVVDDDPCVRDITAIMLSENGYQVLEAADSAAALDVLGREGSRIELVITDYALPGLDGRKLLDIIGRDWPSLPVLIATGYVDSGAVDGELAAHHVIHKPYRRVDLLARIELLRARLPDPVM